VLNISIDGASEDTYNKLRRGGSFAKLLENLEAIKRLKSDHGFELILHFVVQNDNYHELEMMSELAESYDADRMWFNRITDWNTFADFKEVDVMDEGHRNHDDCISAIRRLQEREWKVLIEMPTLLK
jgi:sulfatase maturation enzyme AslB (radical SAM superfamily)